MNAHNLLTQLQQRNIRVRIDGDRLHVIGELGDHDRQLLKHHKNEVMAYLSDDAAANDCPPERCSHCQSNVLWLDAAGGWHCSGCTPYTGEVWTELLCTGDAPPRQPATVPDVTDTDLQRLPPWKRHLVKVHNRATFITMADGSTWEVATAEVLRHAIAADYSDLLNTLIYRAFATLLIEDRLVEAYPLWTPRIVQCQACQHAGAYPYNSAMVTCCKGWGWVNPLNARWKTDWIQCPDYSEQEVQQGGRRQ